MTLPSGDSNPDDRARVDLKDLTFEELAGLLERLGEKPFRARQIWKWLYKFGVEDFEEMTDLSRNLRARLNREARLGKIRKTDVRESGDGSRKILWELEDRNHIESVLIPERNHYTLCVSSQVGCAMGCRFCRTAGLGLTRNLKPSEIIDQALAVKKELGEDRDKLTNLVFMGMGEPLANRVNVVRALKVLTEPGLVGLARRHLSLSTVGLVSQLPLLAEEIEVGLTVSLNAPDDKRRDYLMPVNRRHPMSELHRTLRAFPLPHRRRITIAYVLLAGVNDSEADAALLAAFLHGLKVKINLIPFNSWPGCEFEGSSDEAAARFQEILIGKNYTAIIRKSKGRDVGAACGQLAGEKGDVRVKGAAADQGTT